MLTAATQAVLNEAMLPPTSPIESITRLVLACVFGALIGMERQIHGRAAGLRTMMLVALGCALVMLASNYFAELYTGLGLTDESVVRLDPARLAYGVMTGIGFLGAGVIIRTGVTVRGLTTAATIWCVAAIGLAAGIGLLMLAALATALVLIALFLLDLLESRMESHWYKLLHVTLPDEPGIIDRFSTKLEEHKAKVLDISIERKGEGALKTTYSIRLTDRKQGPVLFETIGKEPEVQYIRLE